MTLSESLTAEFTDAVRSSVRSERLVPVRMAVLQTGAWPLAPAPVPLPELFMPTIAAFEAFYGVRAGASLTIVQAQRTQAVLAAQRRDGGGCCVCSSQADVRAVLGGRFELSVTMAQVAS